MYASSFSDDCIRQINDMDGNSILIGYLPVVQEHHPCVGGSSNANPDILTGNSAALVAEPQNFQLYVPTTATFVGNSGTADNTVESVINASFQPHIFLSDDQENIELSSGKFAPENNTSRVVLLPDSNILIPSVSSNDDGEQRSGIHLLEAEESSVYPSDHSVSNQNTSGRRLLNLDLLTQQAEAEKRKERMITARKKSFMPRCETCDELLKSVSQFRAHARKCRHTKQFACDKCGEGFNQRLNFDLHVATHSIGSSSKMLCPACGKEFSRLASFKCHLTLHRVDDSAVCDICREEFPFYTQLKKHVRLFHIRISGEAADEDSYVFCKECGLVLDCEDDLKNHRLTHRKIRETMRLTSKKRKPISARGRKGRPGQRHQCTLCEKILSSHSALQRHKVIHTGQKPYECSACGKKFSQKGSLMFHEAIHFKEKPYSCQLCGMGFTQRGNLRKHVERLHPANVADRPAYRCPLCSCVFKNVQPLNAHLTKRHSQVSGDTQQLDQIASAIVTAENSIEFDDSEDLVGESGPSTSDLLKDAIAQSGIDPVLTGGDSTNSTEPPKNERSGKQLAAISQKLLKKATVELLKRHTKKTQKPLGDSFCGSQLKGVRVVVERGKRLWICPHCSRKLTRGSDMVRHMRVHSGEKPYSCAMCGKSYSLRSTLQQHLRHHLGISAERCHICLKSLATASALRKHMKLHNRQTISCSLCGDTFPTLARLNRHLEKAHNPREGELLSQECLQEPLLETNSGEFVQLVSSNPTVPHPSRQNHCRFCPAAYKRLKHLKDHMKIAHGSGASYHCRQCGRCFLTSRYLRDHLKRHSGRKPYSCHNCSKSFISAGALKRHSVVHSDQRPFLCPYCNRRFKRGVQCRKHIKTVHRDSALPPPDQMVDVFQPVPQVPQVASYSQVCQEFMEESRSDLLLSSAQNLPLLAEKQNIHGFESVEHELRPPEAESAFLDLSSVIGGVLSPDAATEIQTSFQHPFSKQPNAAFSCSVCCQRVEGFGQLLNHIARLHPNEHQFQFSCPKCAQLMRGAEYFIQHVQQEHGELLMSEHTSIDLPRAENYVTVSPVQESTNEKAKQVLPEHSVAPETELRKILVGFPGSAADSLKNKVCHLCNKGFRKANDLERHMRIHTGEKPFSCSFCGKSFRVKSTLTNHTKTHSDEVPNGATHVCQVCNKEFMSRGSLKVHLRIHTNEHPFQCQLCLSTFRTSSARKLHYDREHSLNKKKSKVAVLTAENLETVLVGGPTQSVSVGKSEHSAFDPVTGRGNIVSGLSPQRLSLSVRPDPNGMLQVEVRPLPFDGHISRNVPDSEVIIEVSTLEELVEQGMVLNIPLSSNSVSLSQVTVDPLHLLQSLEQQGVHLGSVQREILLQSSAVGDGLPEESAADKFIVECKICDMNFRTPEDSSAHFRSEDHETAMFTAGHVRSDRKFPCQYCVKAFEHKWKLDRHVRVHSKVRPFLCEFCDKSFNQRASMQKHVEGVHLNKRNFNCEWCGKSFQHKWNLNRHWKSSKTCSSTPVSTSNNGPVIAVQPQWEENGVEKSLLLSL